MGFARVLVIVALTLAGCGGSDGGPAGGSRGTAPVEIEVPATIIGELEISVEEGPVGDDDLSEVNFGSIETDAGPVLVEVWADVVRAGGLTREDLVAGGRYRVELVGRAEYATPALPSYRVGALEPVG